METLYERCCGVDVHKRGMVACLRKGRKQELREYKTTTQALREMGQWLEAEGCQMVAMESTGSYWKPVYNVLELLGIEVIIVNAQHMKAVPGRKTDIKDAAWIADLLQHGLLRASYIPSKEQRELREISRYRKSLVEERAREINRLEKILEGANIKISSYLSSLTTQSGQNLIRAAAQGAVREEDLDALVCGNLRASHGELMEALDGAMTKVQRKLVLAILEHIEDMTRRVDKADGIINDEMAEYENAIAALDEVPGIGTYSAQTILAEIGLDMSRFPTAAHLASWAGLSPGNNESAGKRKSARTCKGNSTLKTTLVQCARSAVKKKGTFYRAQYERVAVRRGSNRAVVAVAHSMLISIWHMLKNGEAFRDLGADYYNQFNKEKKISSYLKKLADLGWEAPGLPAS